MDVLLGRRVERVRAKAAARGVRLDPPRTEHEVAAFEAGAGVALPEGYRLFLLRVGDGPRARTDSNVVVRLSREEALARERREGPPYYGLLPLERTLDPDPVRREPLRPTAPFPLTAPWEWEDVLDEGDPRIDAAYTDGHLNLGTHGCGIDALLVVSGAERGRVWVRAEQGAKPLGADFLDWYEAWLDEPPYWSAPAHGT